MSDTGLNVTMLAKGKARIDLFGILGPSRAKMIDTQTVSNALNDAGPLQEIELHINSQGGDAFEGIGIYNLLKEHPAKKTVVVHGIAASAASVVAMAGDTIRVPRTSRLMIHEPSTFAFGGRDSLRNRLKALEAVQESTVEIYSKRSKLPPERIAEMMKTETYMSGQQAVDAGFADATDREDGQSDGSAVQQSATVDCQDHFLPLLSIAMSTTEEPAMAENTTPEIAQTTAIVPPVAAEPVVAPQMSSITAEDVKAEAAKAVTAERSRISNITAICQKAGKPEMAQQYIDNGAEVGVVQSAMFEILCQNRPPVGDAGGADIQQNNTDPDAAFKAEYAADRGTYMRAGITEESYISSRRIDTGHEMLVAR